MQQLSVTSPVSFSGQFFESLAYNVTKNRAQRANIIIFRVLGKCKRPGGVTLKIGCGAGLDPNPLISLKSG